MTLEYLEGVKIVKGQGHEGSRSNFCISETLQLISLKVGGFMRLDPRSNPEWSKVNVTTGLMSNFSIIRFLKPISVNVAYG